MHRKKKLSMFSTYRQFMETCMVSDGSGALHKIFDEKIFGFGTAIDEKIFGIKEVKKLLNSQQKQSKGLDIKWKTKPVSRYITADENSAVFADDLHLTIRAGKETVKMYLRFSVVLHYSNDQWKAIHWHGSKPEEVESEKDTWGVENWKQKATELERLVDEKTADLVTKNRELEIETALERTRTRSLLMQHSDELLDISKVFHEQLLLLGIDSAFSFVWLPNEEKGDHLFWATWMEERRGKKQFHTRAITYPLDMTEPYTAACFVDWQSGVPVHEHFVASGNIDTFFASWAELLEGAVRLKPAFFPDGIYYTEAFMKYGCFGVDTSRPLSLQEKEILHRFAIEFERSYTRFLDLQKAEVQAREAQIEAALEKVRSRSLAMQKSDELNDVVTVLFEKLKDLSIPVTAVGISINIEGSKDWNNYVCGENENGIAITHYRLPYFNHRIANDLHGAREKGLDFFVGHYSKEEKNSFYEYVIGHSEFKSELREDIKQFVFQSPSYTISVVNTKHAMIIVNDFEGKSLSDSEVDILKRFSKVFDQAYTRFLDLQKAEAQARESQIQLALERVRARTMAMQKSEELQDVVHTLLERLKELNVEFYTAIIILFQEDSKDIVWWLENKEKLQYSKILIPYTTIAYLQDLFDAREIGIDHFSKTYSFREKNELFQHLFSNTAFQYIPDKRKEFLLETEAATMSVAIAKNTGIHLTRYSTTVFSDEDNKILIRFAQVFEQTYTRFLDLQKAEAQAKEAQIEASLERVRSKAMAMHSSQDLADTIGVFYKELQYFSITPRRCGVGLLNRENKEGELFTWNTTELGESLELVGKIQMEGHPVLENVYSGWLSQKDYFPVLKGNEIKEYYKVVRPMVAFPDYDYDTVQYGYFFFFPEGGVYAWTDSEMKEDELQIYRRFTSVLSLTYKRFKDLQQAEAQAREAQIEAALERVRSRTLAMQKSDELADTAAELFKQLIGLGIEPNRLYIGIVNGNTKDMEMWATDEDGTGVGRKFTFNAKDNASVKKLFDGWLSKIKSVTVDMQGRELEDYIKYLQQLQIPLSHALTQKRRVQSVAYFDKGFIGMASPDEQSSNNIHLLERFAAVFNLTFTRFNDLKIAEAHALQAEQDLIAIKEAKQKAEEALTELQATQKQLIQSEKMASLGELTAGIAHEIQNPLNFVNNFSEVSKELLDEMKDELEKGNIDDAKEIMNDVIQNLEKINHHGKRADGIVKGMLQHSRSSSNTKEPTDINALCDEYLRLAYHGLRAKDKSFNAKFESHFDESVGKIEVMPQDMGRVVLNLINNAFYAASLPSKGGFPESESKKTPTVWVSTKKEGDKILISVRDNGPGIPATILDKIFQPFFTTKPTGQGTGLGLSLSYDIVKAHGGEIKVDSKNGEGTAFIIQLPV